MNLKALINEVRVQLADYGELSVRVTDDRIARLLNEAETEAAVRARLLIDSGSDRVDVRAGEPLYTLNPLTFFVERVYSPILNRCLTKTSHHDLDNDAPQWYTVSGNPSHYMLDMGSPSTSSSSLNIRLYPIPIANDRLELTVYRLPLNPLASPTDEPEIPTIWHNHLIDWVCYRLLSEPSQSAELRAFADFYRRRFEDTFGERADARRIEWRRKQRPKRVISRWL